MLADYEDEFLSVTSTVSSSIGGLGYEDADGKRALLRQIDRDLDVAKEAYDMMVIAARELPTGTFPCGDPRIL